MTDKGRILAFPDTAAIEAEAAAWVARFDAGDVSAKDQAAFQEWLNRSSLHRETIVQYGNLWSEFDALGPLAGRDRSGWQVGAQMIYSGALRTMRPWLAAAAIAMIAVVAGTAAFYSQPRRLAQAGNAPLDRIAYETAIGGQKRVTLADGSTVILNTNSRLEVNFSGGRRDIHLLRGEAYFDVVHDKARPFTVYANNYVVRDIGTAFDVHLSKAGMVEVGVTKGSVEVRPAETGRAAGAGKAANLLTAGQNIVLGPAAVEHTQTVSSADMGRKLAWRQGRLIYSGQPLGAVLADISRYSDLKIEVGDPALENLPVGGAFRTDQIEAIFAALEDNFGVRAEWIDPQHVRFVSGPEKPATKD
jgi:transmembrane sensor